MIFFSIYNKFKLKKWSTLTPGKRQRILEKVEKKQARRQHREPLAVIMKTDPNWKSLGMFESGPQGKRLYLNVKLITDVYLRFHALETIFHEGRHAYQNHVITNRKILGPRARKWRRNYRGYITSGEDMTIYSFQPIERDAQRYAIKKLARLGWRYKNEPDYDATMDQMIYRYENTLVEARRQHGVFYRYKINKRIKEKSRH